MGRCLWVGRNDYKTGMIPKYPAQHIENIPKSAASDKEDLWGTVYDKGKIPRDYIIMATGRSPRV